MNITSILIGGAEWIDHCRYAGTRIKHGLNGQNGTADLDLILDKATYLAGGVINGDEVLIETAGGRIFGGNVARPVARLENPEMVGLRLSCIDKTRLLDSVVIDGEVLSSQFDDVMIADLFTRYPCGISTALYVSRVALIPSKEIANQSLRAVLEEIAKLTQALWYVDPYARLHYFAEGTRRSPFSLAEMESTTTGTEGTEWGVDEWGNFIWGQEGVAIAKTFLREGFEYESDFSTPANQVRVVGAREPDVVNIAELGIPLDTDDGVLIFYHDVWPVDTAVAGPPYEYVENEEAYWGPEYGYEVPAEDGNYANLCNTYAPTALADFSVAGPLYEQSNILMRFDTSEIPADAVIESASIVVWMNKLNSVVSDHPKIGIEYYSEANWPIEAGDWDSSGPSATACAYQEVDTDTWEQRAFPLLTPALNLNRTGYTGFRWHLKCDAAPTGYNRYGIGLHGFYPSGFSGADMTPYLKVGYRIAGTRVEYTADDATSQAAYGVWKRTIVDEQIVTVEEAQLRAQYELVQFANPIVSGSLQHFHDGQEVGQLVRITDSNLGIDTDLLIRELEMTWATASSITRYRLAVGGYRPDLVEILRKMALASQAR